MNQIIRRRASLGLAIQGPFSRNRRRRDIREAVPGLTVAALVTGIAAFCYALFF